MKISICSGRTEKNCGIDWLAEFYQKNESELEKFY